MRNLSKTRKADRLSTQLGTWKSFLEKKLHQIEEKYILPDILKKFTFETAKKIDEIKSEDS